MFGEELRKYMKPDPALVDLLIRNRFCDVHAQASVSERKGALSCGNYVGKVLRGQEL